MVHRQLQRVGEFVLGEELGEGGMGCVFAAAASNGAPVAIKLLHPSFGTAAMHEHLLEEARLVRRISHPNVMSVLASGVAFDGRPYVVMRRAEGTPLGISIRRHGPLPMQRIRAIATQILDGLGAIHAAGLVHGDLKSDNVLVDDRDRVTIIDFGLTRPAGTAPTWLGEDVLTGTPEYMAPEAVKGELITAAADIYAAGIIVYEMLAGTTPFGGGEPSAVVQRHITDDVVPPSLRCTDRRIPIALDALVVRALAKSPEQRHHSARQFASGLERAIPACWAEEPMSASSSAFSTTASTRAWKGPRASALRPRRRRRNSVRKRV